MARIADWVEFCLRETVVGVAGAIALHADHSARRRGQAAPHPGDDLAAGTAAVVLVDLAALAAARRLVRRPGRKPRRSGRATAHRTARRI